MHSFTDKAGRIWEISINVATADRLHRSPLAIHVVKLIDDGCKGLGELLGDPLRLMAAIYILCRDQAGNLKVDEPGFGAAMSGDVIEKAAAAFWEELSDFFPPERREILRKIHVKAKTVETMLLTRTQKQVDELDTEILFKSAMNSFGVLPESSESTPDHSLSANSPA